MDTLHRLNYDLSSALSVLVPAGGPVLCRDEMEEWSASEAAMFEEALEKYGKDFNDIRQDFVSVAQMRAALRSALKLQKNLLAPDVPPSRLFSYLLPPGGRCSISPAPWRQVL